MQNGLTTIGRKIAFKGIVVQLIVSFFLIITVALVQLEYITDVIFGCLSFVVPHSIFAYWVFRYAGATKNEIVAQSFSQGMKLKLILTSVVFVIAFTKFNVHPLPLLGAYAVIMVSQWITMYQLTSHKGN